MKSLKASLRIPFEACAYEEYDPVSLIPSNTATAVRMLELDWDADQFFKKTVLDIGCNTGALSVYASRLGASKIQAIDVQDSLLEFFKNVVEIHTLNIIVQKKNFNDLVVEEDAADVVLMMEVMHWLVDQGGNVVSIIKKLSELTNETLYLETPWDISEPSIAKKNIIKAENYNPELIISELSKYFHDVKICRFMTYFGRMKNSKRVLIKAYNKRLPLPVLEKMKDVFPLNIDLSVGSNTVTLVTSPDGPLVVKKIANYSLLTRISESVLNEFIGMLPSDGLIPPPILLGDSYRYETNIGEFFMAYQFRGNINDLVIKSNEISRPDNHYLLNLALESRKIFRHASPTLLRYFSEQFEQKTSRNIKFIKDKIPKKLIRKFLKVLPFMEQVYLELPLCLSSFSEAIIHGDIQVGNLIYDSDQRISLIDLDNIKAGTIYSDLLIAGIFAGANLEGFRNAIKIQSADELRMLNIADIIFSVDHIIGWLEAISSNAQPDAEIVINRVLNGLLAIKDLYDETR